MFSFFLVVLFLTVFNVSDCTRRIINGSTVKTDKRYVVYLVQAPVPQSKRYDAWLCGGAIVSSLFIITSAACVDDVGYLYAIAGYKTYVPDKEIDTDQCTKEKKKKVVYTCIPTKYELEYDKIEKWSYIDIALAKVESAYDFQDTSYATVCSYTPAQIRINFEPKYQNPDVDAMVFGWGHHEKWRTPEDSLNYNEKELHYASVVIMQKNKCKKKYEKYAEMASVIDQFMICTSDSNPGNINEQGDLLVHSAKNVEGCEDQTSPNKIVTLEGLVDECQDDINPHVVDNTRKNIDNSNKTYYISRNKTANRTEYYRTQQIRRSGICQNDHGGPLVTWVGANEVLIGIASVFQVSTEESTCMGPFLYTSTQCNGAFIDCVLTTYTTSKKKRRSICDSPPIQRGYDTIERYISWKSHPAGPADNERLENNPKNQDVSSKSTKESDKGIGRLSEYVAMRPQLPLRDLNV